MCPSLTLALPMAHALALHPHPPPPLDASVPQLEPGGHSCSIHQPVDTRRWTVRRDRPSCPPIAWSVSPAEQQRQDHGRRPRRSGRRPSSVIPSPRRGSRRRRTPRPSRTAWSRASSSPDSGERATRRCRCRRTWEPVAPAQSDRSAIEQAQRHGLGDAHRTSPARIEFDHPVQEARLSRRTPAPTPCGSRRPGGQRPPRRRCPPRTRPPRPTSQGPALHGARRCSWAKRWRPPAARVRRRRPRSGSVHRGAPVLRRQRPKLQLCAPDVLLPLHDQGAQRDLRGRRHELARPSRRASDQPLGLELGQSTSAARLEPSPRLSEGVRRSRRHFHESPVGTLLGLVQSQHVEHRVLPPTAHGRACWRRYVMTYFRH